MKLLLETPVAQSYLSVKAGFDESLFRKLSPPFPPVKLLRFDGCAPGDQVILELNFIFFTQKWTSAITEDGTSEAEYFFVDEGIVLPFFLKKWTHRHRIIASPTGSRIRDEIEYESSNGLLTLLLYPALWAQFLYRKPIYKKVFGRA